MQTVLITGGSGLVGKTLANALLARGYRVIILSRQVSHEQAGTNLSFARWDIKKQEIDRAAIEAADYIVHLAGAGVVEKKWTPAYKKEIVESRTQSSRLLVEALKNDTHGQRNKVKAVISASAIGWYGADTDPLRSFTETDPAADGFLGQTCKLWEDSIEPVTSLGKRLVKLRIGIVLSKEGGALAEFMKPIRFGLAAILGGGKQTVSWIHIDDLCRMFMAAIENEKLSGSYNAVAPHPVSNKTLTLTLAKAMNGKWFVPVHVPAFILKIMMGERSIEVLKSTTVSCKKITGSDFVFRYPSIEKALASLVNK